jgi:hypothetical protein
MINGLKVAMIVCSEMAILFGLVFIFAPEQFAFTAGNC